MRHIVSSFLNSTSSCAHSLKPRQSHNGREGTFTNLLITAALLLFLQEVVALAVTQVIQVVLALFSGFMTQIDQLSPFFRVLAVRKKSQFLHFPSFHGDVFSLVK